MQVLITGVAGFIGSHVASRFLSEGYHVVGVDDLSSGKIENIPSGVEFIKSDLADMASAENLPSGCNLILHLAGQSSGEISFDDPLLDLQKNTVSTLNLIQYGIRNKSARIVYASSMSVYGEVENKPIAEVQHPKPLSCYGVGKLASEGYLKVFQNQLPYVALRMFNVYGPGQDLTNLRQGMVSIYLAQAINSRKIEVKGNLSRYRDFIYIDDVVETWFRSATYKSAENQIFNVGTGVKTTIGELLEIICKNVQGADFFVQGSTPGDQNGIFADNSNLKNILGINNFKQLDEGISVFNEWANHFLNNYKINKQYSS
jgi:UDP-glucose 4-epimerase